MSACSRRCGLGYTRERDRRQRRSKLEGKAGVIVGSHLPALLLMDGFLKPMDNKADWATLGLDGGAMYTEDSSVRSALEGTHTLRRCRYCVPRRPPSVPLLICEYHSQAGLASVTWKNTWYECVEVNKKVTIGKDSSINISPPPHVNVQNIWIGSVSRKKKGNLMLDYSVGNRMSCQLCKGAVETELCCKIQKGKLVQQRVMQLGSKVYCLQRYKIALDDGNSGNMSCWGKWGRRWYGNPGGGGGGRLLNGDEL